MGFWKKSKNPFLQLWRSIIRSQQPAPKEAPDNKGIEEELSNVDVIDEAMNDDDITYDQDDVDATIDHNEIIRRISRAPKRPLPKSDSTTPSLDVSEVKRASQSAYPLLDDQPSALDSLDFTSYVQALKDIITHNETRTPFTLGIFGRWGMGKTTLMKMLEKDLNQDGITTIWFNAWQYSNEDELWAAFLQSILNKIQNSLGSIKLPIFKMKLLLKRIKWNDVPNLVLQFLFRIIIAILPILFINPASQQLTPLAKSMINLGGNAISVTLAYLILLKPILDSVRKNTTINMSDFQQASNYQEHIAFLDKFREHFSDVVQSLPQKGGKRLAIFIDDLDRCSPERTIQVLDAIKLFVDVSGCIFVLGLDVDVVQKAVATKYKDDPTAQREYVGKIIQLPFQLPPLTRNEMQGFLRRLTLNLPDHHCQDVFITGLGVNPREIKRTINIFSLLWNLASKRNELKGRITPVRLAKVVVIQQGYPEIHRILQQHPYLLKDIENYYRIQAAGTTNKVDESTEIQSQNSQVKPNIDLPADVKELIKNETLRSMLLLHDVKELVNFDSYNFSPLQPDEIAIYFTLTSRAEAPIPIDNPDDDKYAFSGTDRPRGYVVAGRYIVSYELGRGGMSTVYSAFDNRVEKTVAMKFLLVDSPQRREKLESRLKVEMRTLSKLNHPNIVPIYDYGIDKGSLYYVMEYLSGGSLNKKGKLSYDKALKTLYPLLDVLEYVHEQKVVHRDIKPNNILFDDVGKLFLVDFGILKLIDVEESHGLTGTGKIVGTPAYMSPEQIRGREVDGRSDLYSFGITLFELIAGRKPYNADTPIELCMQHLHDPIPKAKQYVRDLPKEIDQVITKCLAKYPSDRYQTAQEVKTALLQIVTQ
jgi:hypothetical protein